jgi:hypothetical protein
MNRAAMLIALVGLYVCVILAVVAGVGIMIDNNAKEHTERAERIKAQRQCR